MAGGPEVRVSPAPACFLCEKPGLPLYAGQLDRLFDAPGRWNLRRCASCGLAWLDPQPIPEDIEKLYVSYHTHEGARSRPSMLVRLQAAASKMILPWSLGYEKSGPRTLRGKWLSWMPPLRDVADATVRWLQARPGGRLLDVGCGDGSFLGAMQTLGWEVEGLDPDPAAVRAARERLGPRVREGTLESVDPSTGPFDALTLSHVIEHVPDPVGLLGKCGDLLAPGGWVVVVTPNAESLGRRSFGPDWRGWETPRHLHLFTTRSLAEAARRASLRIRTLRTSAQTALWIWWSSRLLRRDGVLPGGAPRGADASLLVQGALFHLAEELFNGLRKRLGEELVMIATRHS